MGFNFPNSPTQGQLFTPVGGYQYVYLDGVWRVVEGPQDVGTAQARNRIVNPCFQISQENGSTLSVATSYYQADQWATSWSSAVGQAGSGRTATASPNGSIYAGYCYVNVADTSLATEWLGLYQSIEGTRIADFRWGTVNARQVVLRFWAFTANAPGTYGGAIRNTTGNRTYPFSFTLAANTWTEFVKVIPGDTTGTWPTDTSKACDLWFTWAAAGTQVAPPGVWKTGNEFGATGQSNGFAVVGNVFYVADVGLYLDPQATGIAPPWQMPDEAEELRACQRYWEKLGDDGITITFSGNTTASSGYFFVAPYKVTKRIVPAVTGVHTGAAGFPAAIGTLAASAVSVRETRTSNATTSAAVWGSTITANARM